MVILFNSWQFLLFFPCVTLIYFIIPDKFKTYWLLASSWFFYMSWNPEYGLLLLTSTAVTYIGGLLISRLKASGRADKNSLLPQKLALFAAVFIDLGILFWFKYSGFAADLIQKAGTDLGMRIDIPQFDIVLPVGISFYTFQAIGYIADVYRGDTPAEKNFFRYALFVSFFPQLVAGPIERSGKLLKQLSEPKKYDHKRACEGLLIMLWGFFLKIVIADRAAVFVDTVYGSYLGYDGSLLLAATVLFAVQIYCDFAGYSSIAVGAARVIGIELTDNFDAPYLSSSVSIFWKRWHISLTSWFKDYIYIPLGGNKKGKLRKYLNTMTVFLISGLWHGAELSFVLWGAINGLYQIFEDIVKPVKEKLCSVLHVGPRSFLRAIPGSIITFIVVDFSWIFFRAPDIPSSFAIIKSIFYSCDFSEFCKYIFLRCGLDRTDMILLLFCILILAVSDICKRCKLCLYKKISGLPFAARCLFITAAVSFILLFGIWGSEFNAADFIYFSF